VASKYAILLCRDFCLSSGGGFFVTYIYVALVLDLENSNAVNEGSVEFFYILVFGAL
jgi:hypothetical protein